MLDSASADAAAYGAYLWAGGSASTASAVLTNGTAGAIHAQAAAVALGSWSATASATAIGADLAGGYAASVSLGLDNSGDIGGYAYAYANGFTANANAWAQGAVLSAESAGTIDLGVTNASTGLIHASAEAYANAFDANANAWATGVDVSARSGESITANVSNLGTISADAHAWADGVFATGEANANGVYMAGGSAGSVTLGVNNSGIIDAYALANVADTGEVANAYASADGIDANVYNAGTVDITITNASSGLIHASGEAYASAFDAFAWAGATGVDVSAWGAGSITANVSNLGTISADAYAWADGFIATAEASAAGVAMSGGDVGGDLTFGLVNSGDIDGLAWAAATGFDSLAGAWADGAQFYASGASGAIGIAMTNNSGATVHGSAWAYAGGATGDANAWATGAQIGAYNAASIDVSLDNMGTISADAYATAEAGDADAYGWAAGAWMQAGGDSGSVNIDLTNSGVIDAYAYALATGWDVPAATGEAVGVWQNGFDANTVDVSLFNSGTISAVASGFASGGEGDLYGRAWAGGVWQIADAGGSQLSATASLTNTGAINVYADANANGAGADATAWASGIYQNARDANQAMATIVNDGSISVTADAYVSGAGEIQAWAGAGGIYQQADSDQSEGGTAVANLTNNAELNVEAQALASGVGSGVAYATAEVTGIDQQVSDGREETIGTIVNNGHISLLAQARAYSSNDAHAYASIDDGIQQTVDAGGESALYASANISNTNPSSIDITALATASGSDAWATAYIDTGIDQEAQGAQIVDATIDNSGAISMFADANAYATDQAFADATINYGIWQSATANTGARISADVTLNNSGSIIMTASALATGVSTPLNDANYASASAEITHGIKQYGGGGEDVSVTLTNSATIDMLANASAFGLDTSADAYAYIGTGISQYANAGGDRDTATNSLNNSGSIDIAAVAFASGEAEWSGSQTAAHAVASISEYGIYQYAGNADETESTLTNSGSISILADASAYTLDDDARAYAEVNTGIYQEAYAGSDQVDAAVLLTNASGATIDIRAHASASGLDVTIATADAYFEYGIYQYAHGAAAGSATLTNNGTLNIVADAYARATGSTPGYASAQATGEIGIGQYAYQDGVEYDLTATTLTNTGTLNIHALADAAGSSADAYASVNKGISQYAYEGETATAVLDNSNALSIMASAQAVATDNSAEAWATVNTGIYQYAYAAGDDWLASVELINSGVLGITALAVATGQSGADADASAEVTTGIYQQATSGDTAIAAIDNSGTLTIKAQASAHTTGETPGFAYANASVTEYGIYQYADAGDDEQVDSVTLTNTGTLQILAVAQATGSGATAYAYIDDYGIYQYSEDGDDVSSNATIDNDGILIISADALAVATAYKAYAYAEVNTGIYQSQDGGYYSTGTASIDNSATLGITAHAVASGATSASAQAWMSYGIEQYSDGQDALATIDNSGSLTIMAQATAGMTASAPTGGWASANATINYGIYQSADAGNEEVSDSVVLTNSGTLTIAALADASAGSAYASAEIDDTGIYQYAADGDQSATMTLDNSGLLTILADAHAVGSTGEADAYASVYQGIYQDGGDGYYGDETATIVNSGTLGITALAVATGVYSVSATAFIETGIRQSVDDGADATATIDNSGSLTIMAQATARASNTEGTAFASANATINYGISQTADSGGNELTATAMLTNSGVLDIAALAQASGSSASASAEIDDYGIYQEASDGDVTNLALIDNSSLLTIRAEALANATGESADAYAEVYTGIYQYASDGETATASLVNSGTLEITAFASANGVFDAHATGYIDTGIYQEAAYADNAVASIDNSGTLSIRVEAQANAPATGTTGIGGYAYASALFSSSAIYQSAEAGGDRVSALATLTNSGTMTIEAIANAAGSSAYASASIDEYGLYQYAWDAEVNQAVLDNSGPLSMLARASALATDSDAYATATIDTAIYQSAYGATYADLAEANLTNSATLSISALAWASGANSATAYAYVDEGISQYAYYADVVNATLDNTGSLAIVASATAIAGTGEAYASATVGYGIYQYVSASYDRISASASLNNTGAIDIVAHADASGAWGVTASAEVGYAIYQYANGANETMATLDNSSSIDVQAIALAVATDYGLASASASVSYGIYQSAVAGGDDDLALASIVNSGSIGFLAQASAAGVDTADANATAYGAYQYANSGEISRALFDNTGSFDVQALASASATSGNASAYAYAFGVFQSADAGFPELEATVSIVNSGTFAVNATAFAYGSTGADATAYAYGVQQVVQDSNAVFDNSGSFTVVALAQASGESADAYALASGLSITSGGTDPLLLDISNSGVFSVQAWASAVGSPTDMDAEAYGIAVFADYVAGDITNTGSMLVVAIAQTASETGGGTGTATATGIEIGASEFTGTITNEGSLGVYAAGGSTGTGTSAAVGIIIWETGEGAADPDALGMIVNNSGSIVAATLQGHGTAIDVSDAPNAILISLMGEAGDGYIYGDIDLSDDDSIEVSAGVTWFDGDVNPDGTNEGFLDILAGGEFVLMVNEDAEAGAQVNVEEYIQDADGVVAFEINGVESSFTPFPGNLAGQINADVVDLGGGAIRVVPLAGYYDDIQIYEEIVVQNAGTTALGDGSNLFGTTILDSALLDASVVYQGDNTADLMVERTAFNEVLGMTPNQNAIGGGIENAYGTGGSGVDGTAFGDEVVTLLFTLGDDEYPGALDSLGGAEYGQGMQAALGSIQPFIQGIKGQMGGGSGGSGGSAFAQGSFVNEPYQVAASDSVATDGVQVAQAGDGAGGTRETGLSSVWVRGYSMTGDNGGDLNASGFDQKQFGVVAGVDFVISDQILLGVAAGYLDNQLDFVNGNEISSDGYQLGAYINYDIGDWFVDGILTYAGLSSTSQRYIPLLDVTATGGYDTSIFGLSATGGYDFQTEVAKVTPFVGLDYVSASNDSFTETGAGGANLDVTAVDGDSFAASLGVRAETEFKAGENTLIVPNLSLAWQQELGDNTQEATANFSGVAASSFTVAGSDVNGGSTVVGVGITIKMQDTYELFVDYDARFNGDYDQQAVSGGFRMKF